MWTAWAANKGFGSNVVKAPEQSGAFFIPVFADSLRQDDAVCAVPLHRLIHVKVGGIGPAKLALT